MGLLGEIFSSGDRMKRKLRGLLDDPMGTIALGSQRMSEDVQQMGLLADESGYLPGTNSVLLTPQQKERARKALADKGAEMALAAATVWHGSPHKFDKFDSSKIGTGEGAQAYGHGLYFAESPSVAKSYADTLSQYHIGTRDGVKSGGDFADALVANAGDYPASLSSAIRSQANKVATDLADGKTAEHVIASMRNGPYARMYSGLADAVEKMSPTKAGGSLYKVDLPDEHIAKMLDWDKPLSRDSNLLGPVQQRIQAIDTRIKDIASSVPKGARPDKALIDEVNALHRERATINMVGGSGADVYNSLARVLGGQNQASSFIKQQGVPGIRYLDGGSRGAGQGSSNFVVFPGNEGLLSILERNGQPLK